ncbi:enolase C-terminal domain-like protein [Curtobacterium ammoniigenes]|uniref:enolase C-terminal domain-like protein n=1 Tax=Curtobacterium ammoniigenes TaxID=395387 RepID=UPI00082F817A|nr:enolase C-terminal domain-like protein [Curtobacterium ammoniigenes]
MSSTAHEQAVDRIRLTACTIPTTFDGKPQPESDGTATWDSTTILLAEISAGGRTGLGYAYTSPAALPIASGLLADVVLGTDPYASGGTWLAMAAAVRNAGWPGVCASAISAIDVALHDLAARLSDVSLLRMLGAARDRVMAYGSGGFTDRSDRELTEQMSRWAEEGYRAVKLKIGTHPEDDPRRVALVRNAVGDDVQVFVDANGAYSRKQALELADRFMDESHVTWFEEPVSSDDLAGLHLIRDRGPAGMQIAAGEYGYTPAYFHHMLAAEAVDTIQADATRCGGVTGFRSAALQAWAVGIPSSAHTSPALHATIGAAMPGVVNVEAFHDHLVIERQLFDGLPALIDGDLVPDATAPGLGLSLRSDAVAHYRVGAWDSAD